MNKQSGYFVGIFTLIGIIGCVPNEYQEMQTRCRALEAGSSEQQVRKVLGDPIYRSASTEPGTELWFYWMGGDLAPLSIVMSNASSGAVVKRPCI